MWISQILNFWIKDENTLLFKVKKNEEIIHGKFKIKAIKTEHTDEIFWIYCF